MIISPNAPIYKDKYFAQNLELASRVVIISKKIEDVITDRKLDGYLGPFNSARGHEKDMWEKQSWTQI